LSRHGACVFDICPACVERVRAIVIQWLQRWSFKTTGPRLRYHPGSRLIILGFLFGLGDRDRLRGVRYAVLSVACHARQFETSKTKTKKLPQDADALVPSSFDVATHASLPMPQAPRYICCDLLV
jgi:hypothetical protein